MLWAALNCSVNGALKAMPCVRALVVFVAGCLLCGVRHMVDEPDFPAEPPAVHEDVKRMIAETQALRDAVSEMILAWSAIESQFSLVLRNVLNDDSGAYAFAIYYAPSGSEVRIKIVDAAFDTLAGAFPAHYERITSVWERMLDRVYDVKLTRNAVAHGAISTFFRFGKNHVRLMPQIFDWRRIAPAVANEQVPGLASNDIKQSIAKIRAMTEVLTQFIVMSSALRAGDETTSLKILAQLEVDPRIQPPPIGDQKKPKPQNPLHASRAIRKAMRKKLWKKPK